MIHSKPQLPADLNKKVERRPLLKRNWPLLWAWLAATLSTLGLIFLLHSFHVLRGVDVAFYDWWLKGDTHSTPQEIVIVAIDDESLRQLGQWPWPREFHAVMLNKLAEAKPKAVGLNLLFFEPSTNIKSDLALAAALRLPDLGKVFLPVAASTSENNGDTNWQKPIPLLADAATGLGHVNIKIGDDGLVRSMYIFPHEGLNQKPSLPYQLFKAAYPDALQKYALPEYLTEDAFQLPYSNKLGHFRTVSFISVLRGEVPSSVFAEKLVLVGLTAKGMGDHYSTPTYASSALLPGVEIAATALEGLLEQRLKRSIFPNLVLATHLTLALIWMIFSFFLKVRTRTFIFLVMGSFSLIYVSKYLIINEHVWWPVADLIIGFLSGYLFWVWLRLSIFFSELKLRTNSLISKVSFDKVPTLIGSANAIEMGDILSSLDLGLNFLESSGKHISDILHRLPEAFFLTNEYGHVAMSNERALSLLNIDNTLNLEAFSLIPMNYNSDLNHIKNWNELMSHAVSHSAQGIEIKLSSDVYVLLRATAIQYFDNSFSFASDKTWWIVIVLDISKQKKAQQKYDDALQLQWHDLRAPQSVILSLLDKQSDDVTISPQQLSTLKQKITTEVNATLGLIDSFVWQLRAESGSYEYREVDLIQLIVEVIDRAWPLAHKKEIRLSCNLSNLYPHGSSSSSDDLDVHDEPCDQPTLWLRIEPTLMRRAILNLVENSIKYSPENSEIVVSVQFNVQEQKLPASKFLGRLAEIRVIDNGYGIYTHNLPYIFDAHTRFSLPDNLENSYPIQDQIGHGLGLHLVKTVIDIHGGTIQCESIPGKGTTFVILLPEK